MNKLIKLKFSTDTMNTGKWQIVHEKFIEACTQLDASIFEPYIHEDAIFEDMDKYRFLQSLKDNFDRRKRIGVKQTELRYGNCLGCQHGHQTHEFYNKDSYCFSYIVIKDDLGRVSDIFQCSLSSGLSHFEFNAIEDIFEDFTESREESFEKLAKKNPNINTLKDLFDLE